jgi:CHASE2 domain-containing sensor protein/serine phosphatase RsbU (regulator of sigma subunit)
MTETSSPKNIKMPLRFRKNFAELSGGMVQGLIILGLILAGRLSGTLQFLEWRLFDLFMQVPVPEVMDDRILLVTIDESTLQRIGTYPLPDQVLVDLLQVLQKYNPRVIGLDLFRDFPVEPGHDELKTLFQETSNLIGIEKVLPPLVAHPPDLPPENIGITDALIDVDGRQRNIILGTQTADGFKFSLALKTAEFYLKKEGLELTNGVKDSTTMGFKKAGEPMIELPRFYPNSGSYVRGNTGSGSIQTLLSFRRGSPPFRFVTAEAILAGEFDPSWIADRIILMGVTTPSVPDHFSVAATSVIDRQATWVYGVEIQAHAVSQIISAVLDDRPLIQSWPDWMEYIWISGWGLIGILLAAGSRSPWQTVGWCVGCALGLMGFSYLLFLWGWWIPVVPVLAALSLNSLGLAAFYEYDRRIAAIVEAKQQRIMALQEANETLEERVAERTIELKDANEQLADLLQQLENELKIAQKVQQTMFPKTSNIKDPQARYDIAASHQPARVVGGDLYDFFLLDDQKRLCFLIGDVSGKGTPAALFMVRAITLIRTLAKDFDTPALILEKVNQQLCYENDQYMFVTLFCGIIQIETGELSCASAGHEFPILMNATAHTVEFLRIETGTPLGVDECAEFPLHQYQLKSGDSLLLYTDGVTEARDLNNDEFTEIKLLNLLAETFPLEPLKAISLIRQSVNRFVGEAGQWDDITLLSLQYKP